MNAAKTRLAALALSLVLAPGWAAAMPLAAAKDMLSGQVRVLLTAAPAPAPQSILPAWLEQARQTLSSVLAAL